MKARRPPQSWDYYRAAQIADQEGDYKAANYMLLLYCQRREEEIGLWKKVKPKTARQEEQHKIFQRLGMFSREIANLRMINQWVEFSYDQRTINEAIRILLNHYELIQRRMKTIKERIPNESPNLNARQSSNSSGTSSTESF